MESSEEEELVGKTKFRESPQHTVGWEDKIP